MNVADTLSRRREFHLRTMEFDDALKAYARDGRLTNDEGLNKEL